VSNIVELDVTREDFENYIISWKQQHPGFDETNWWEFYRSSEGEICETDEYFEALEIFSGI